MVELKCIITNGYVDEETIYNAMDKGWTFVTTLPAKNVHPKACDTDVATIFSKYTPYQQDENEIPCNG